MAKNIGSDMFKLDNRLEWQEMLYGMIDLGIIMYANLKRRAASGMSMIRLFSNSLSC